MTHIRLTTLFSYNMSILVTLTMLPNSLQLKTMLYLQFFHHILILFRLTLLHFHHHGSHNCLLLHLIDHISNHCTTCRLFDQIITRNPKAKFFSVKIFHRPLSYRRIFFLGQSVLYYNFKLYLKPGRLKSRWIGPFISIHVTYQDTEKNPHLLIQLIFTAYVLKILIYTYGTSNISNDPDLYHFVYPLISTLT